MKKIFLIVLLLLVSFPCFAATWYVNANTGTGARTGTTEALAFLQMTSAEAAASDGDTVRVANGLYTETHLLVTKQIAWIGQSRDGVVFAPSGTLQAIYMSGSKEKSFTNFTLVKNGASAGIKYLIEPEANNVNTTFNNCRLINGRLGAVYVKAGSSGLVIDNCIVDINAGANYFVSFAGSFTVKNSTINVGTAPTFAVFYQHAATTEASAVAINIDNNIINVKNNEKILEAELGVLVSPRFTNNTINVASNFNTIAVSTINNLNEVIENNKLNLLSTGTSVQGIILSSTTGTASVASIKNNIIKNYNNTNHSIMIGDETGLTSVPGTYDGSTIEGNVIYAPAFFGYNIGSHHAILAGHSQVNVIKNTVYGSAYGCVYKSFGEAYSSVVMSGNKFYNCLYPVRIKGVTSAEVVGNTIISNNGANGYALYLSDNDDEYPAQYCRIRGNNVQVDSGVLMYILDTSATGISSNYNNFVITGDATFGRNAAFTYATMADWATAMSQDANSTELP